MCKMLSLNFKGLKKVSTFTTLFCKETKYFGIFFQTIYRSNQRGTKSVFRTLSYISLGKQATAKINYFHRKLSSKKTESVLNITLDMFKSNKFRNFQSRHRRCSVKKFHYIYKKTPMLESLFNKVVVVQDRKALFNIT